MSGFLYLSTVTLSTNNMQPIITLSSITKHFRDFRGHTLVALDDVSLTIQQGEFLILLGPSGCGKSTLLRIASGLDNDFKGTRAYAREDSTFGFVFQQFALFPWLTVAENIALGLEARGKTEPEITKIVHQELTALGLTGFGHHYPRELSGGMRQRVGIARALAVNPDVIFLDEPFSALDSFTAATLRKDLLRIWEERNITIIMVTHNVEEAITLSDRIAVMTSRPGKILSLETNTLPRPRAERSPEFFALLDKLTASVENTMPME